MNEYLITVIPTGVRPSALGWSNGVEEPAVRLLRQVAVLISLAALLSPVALAQELPEGWRRPTRSETSSEWRKKSPTRFLVVRGDFDGDGKQDLAELLVNESGHQCALFVRLSGTHSNRQKPIWQADSDGPGRFGISIVLPGKHDTYCSSDPSSCDPQTPATVYLKHHGILFISYGQASSLAFWDKRAEKFQWVPMSD